MQPSPAGLASFWPFYQDHFLDSLLIAKTSRTTTSAPITVHIHIPPPIHPYAWFIIESLSFRYDQPSAPDLAREEYDFSSGLVLAMCCLSERNHLIAALEDDRSGAGKLGPCLGRLFAIELD